MYDYYENVNARNYDITFEMLSENFKQRRHCCKADGSFDEDPYIDWWNSIKKVEVLGVRTIKKNEHQAVIEI